MISTLFESLGLVALTAGVVAGLWVLEGVGWALVSGGVIGGGCLFFVGVALSAPAPATEQGERT